MPNKNAVYSSVFTLLFYVGCALGFLAMFFSPFLLSLATALIVIACIPVFIRTITVHWRLLLPLGLLLLLASLDFIRASDIGLVFHHWSFALTLFLFACASLHYFKYNHRFTSFLFFFVLAVVSFVNLHAIIHYFGNKEAIDLLLLQGKSIPLINHFHHIHFGIINGISLLILLFVLWQNAASRKWYMYVVLVLLIFCFHILSSRTGLLSFYLSLALGVVYMAFKEKEWKLLLGGGGTIVLALIAAFLFSSSFKAKINNSIEDYQSWGKGADINFKSMAMRLEANKMALGVFKDHVLAGVGSDQMYPAIAQKYISNKTVLMEENRIPPHNQYLVYAVKYGIPGLLILPFFFIVQFVYGKKNSVVFFLVLCMLATGMIFESLWERQVGVFFSMLFMGLASSIIKE